MKKLLLLSFLTLPFFTGFCQFRYFYGSLSGLNEVPSNGSTATGIVMVKFNPGSKLAELWGNYKGLSIGITMAHIHQGAAGVNGGVVVDLTTTGGISGNLSGTGTLTADQETALLAGNTYVNVHTSNFPPGEIRAQLTPIAVDDALFLNARLQGSQEMPPNPSVGTGFANVLLEKSTKKVWLTGSYANLTTSITNAHIHMGRAASNGAVIVMLENSGGTSGSLHGTGTFTAAQEDSLINGRTYVNVHSGTYTGGELRGQITTYSQQQFLGGRLAGTNEVPSNGSTARGTVIVRFNTTTNELELTGNYEKLTDAITGSHIHNAPAGSNGSVIVNLTNTGGTFGVLTANATLTDPQETALLNGQMYVNVHTSAFPTGEIRAQLMPGTSGETQYSQVLMLGSLEVPPNLSKGTGLGAVMVDKITGQTYVTGAFSELSGNVSSSHIHKGPAGTSGGVVMPLTVDGNTQGVVSGSQVFSPSQVEDYLNGLLYINIHSSAVPGGEIRGQLGNLVLPVKLAYFHGYRQKNSAILLWEAATELNVKQYEVEQQNPVTGTWAQKTIVQAKESSPASYKAEDQPYLYNQAYANYRLRMVDKDGKAAYSQVVKINFASEQSGIILLGNPVNSSLHFIVNGLRDNQQAEAAIIDFNGRKLNRTVVSGGGNQQINVSALSGGVYMLQVQVGNEMLIRRFLKD